MLRLFKAENGMNIVGQGLKIILFTVPSVVVAVYLQIRVPHLARLAVSPSVRVPLGITLLTAGGLLWAVAMVQLLVGFPRGKLVTTGAYGVCRNPIYSSFALLVLPGITLLSGTWVYLCVSLFLYTGVLIFIRTEERQLRSVFGEEYEAYTRRVSRVMPFVRPSRSREHP